MRLESRRARHFFFFVFLAFICGYPVLLRFAWVKTQATSCAARSKHGFELRCLLGAALNFLHYSVFCICNLH